MREILFKGKRIDNGEWLTSKSIDQWDDGRAFLFAEDEGDCIEVIPETVGQFTGLTDRNGVKIFEGDILRDTQGWIYEVKWDFDNGRFLGYHKQPRGDIYICYVGREPKSTIIGNIHDNPELLEDEE